MIAQTVDIRSKYKALRQRSVALCQPLNVGDHAVQPVAHVSPPLWHLAHTTWFFEEFMLSKVKGYKRYNEAYAYFFNSYYEALGERIERSQRGEMKGSTLQEVLSYRRYIDDGMLELLSQPLDRSVETLLTLGLNHEEQHQELLLTDIKYILGHQDLLPAWGLLDTTSEHEQGWSRLDEGVYEVGASGERFAFDNERERHKVYLRATELRNSLVSNAEYLEFMNAGGYSDFRYWHAEGWDWVNANRISAPLYWYLEGGRWKHYTLVGGGEISPDQAVKHISFYEASAFAAWKGLRLPTEFEWEVAAPRLNWGTRWEWTNSAYLPYPGFRTAKGAVGEYNGKFMVNQMVLRGASVATPSGHSRPTYRNFFHPQTRWQFSGLRLARDIR